MNKIAGVTITPLRQVADERGYILTMLRADSPVFERFGEIYFSGIYPGVVKGWHRHREMTLNYAVPCGMIKLVCYDDREESETRGNLLEVFIGERNPVMVTIPRMIWNGFKAVGDESALVANCASIPHSEGEIERLDPKRSFIPYDWTLIDG